MKHITKHQKIPIYKGDFYLIHSDSWDYVQETTKRKHDHDIYGFATCGPFGYALVLNTYLERIPLKYGIITHEAFHIASMILENSGYSHDPNNEEPFAYLAEWIADEAFIFLKENKLFHRLKFANEC